MNEPANKASLLVIDDDQELGQMLGDYLATDNLKITVEHTGERGLATLQSHDFDLLILDIMLPGISGLEVLKQVRRKSQIPVIMLTARGDDIDRIIGLEVGADDYLSKPIDGELFNMKINILNLKNKN